jgi:DNA-directed RNA polymerase beta' subunit
MLGQETIIILDQAIGTFWQADLKDSDNRYPALQLLITKRREDGFQTITMKARCKEEEVPPDYWNFVHGHPGGSKQTRPLLPFEALKILQHIPQEVVEKLGMHNFVARPEALILMCLPVPPSCALVKTPDTPSMVTKVLMVCCKIYRVQIA